MTIQNALQTLYAHMKKQAAFGHAMGLIYYDGATTAPKGTGPNRGETLAILSEEAYKLATSPELEETLEFLHENRAELTQEQARTVELLRKDFTETRAVPMEEFVAYRRLTNEAEDVWHRAKVNDDYASFAPYIDKIVAAQISLARHIAPDKDPYDFRLSRYEEGLNRETCDRFFSALREGLAPVIRRVQAAEPLDDSCLWGHFPIARQRELSDYIMGVIGLDPMHVGIGETEHPFTTCFSRHDVRLTTHYHEDNFSYSMFSVLHEGGHAMYMAHTRPEYAYTCLDDGASMALHESQSRFIENLIGRSRPFISAISPKLRSLFPSLTDVSDEEIYRAVNKSVPSLIRTEADELTYCMHVMVRYELEKRLFAGEITSLELPGEWNRLYLEYVGIEPASNREGVLQDSHWSSGLFGYFPSYALGSAYGAQMLARMRETVDVDAAAARADLTPVTEWLRERIWQYGRLFAPEKTLQNAVGEPFDPKYYVDYLTKKYEDLIG